METLVLERILIKKIGFILLALLITVALGVASGHTTTISREDSVCKLKTISSVPYLYEHNLFDLSQNYFSIYTGQMEYG